MDVLTTVETEPIAALRRAGRFFWLDLERPSGPDLARLGDALDLHELALEDTMQMGQRPKVDRYGDHAMVVWWSARAGAETPDGSIETVEVHVYVSGGYVVTVRRRPVAGFDELRESLRDGAPAGSDAVFRILDVLTDALEPVVDGIEAQVDALEEQVLARPRREHIRAIYRLKQDVRELERRVGAQREQFDAITETVQSLPGLTLGSPEAVNDLRDHLLQASDDLARASEDLLALTSTYFNANTDRLSSIATRLSVLATLFLVWTLVTSFYGMNFKWLTDNIVTFGDFLLFGVGVLVLATVLTAGLLWWRRRDLV